MSALKTWLVEPLDPPVFGDGRSIAEGNWNTSLPWPYPSTVAGAVRSRLGEDGSGQFDVNRLEELLAYNVWGPHPVELDPHGSTGVTWLFAAPDDHRVLCDGNNRRLLRCLPLDTSTMRHSGGLLPVGPSRYPLPKPGPAAALWSWALMERWLGAGDDQHPDGLAPGVGEEFAAPDTEARIHVALEPGAEVAKDGALFATAGRAYLSAGERRGALAPPRRLALAVRTDGALRAGLGQLGGEQRMARWVASSVDFPSMPKLVAESVRRGFVRVIFTTPTWFRHGSRAESAWGQVGDGKPEVIAAAHGRPAVVSGWDYRHNRPKPTRRLVPAGAVFFLKLPGTEAERIAWADRMWGRPVCDEPAESDARKHPDFCPARSGFGIALLGAWSGIRATLRHRPS